jgi:hypothetical protein
MAAKLTRLTHKIAIQLHLVAESCTICSSRSRGPVRKLLDTPSYCRVVLLEWMFSLLRRRSWAVCERSLNTFCVIVEMYLFLTSLLLKWSDIFFAPKTRTHEALCNLFYWITKITVFGIANYLTNSMEQSHSWEANDYSASQEIPLHLWNPKVHYRVHNSLPLVTIMSQMHPVHTFPPYFHEIHSNIILPSTPLINYIIIGPYKRGVSCIVFVGISVSLRPALKVSFWLASFFPQASVHLAPSNRLWPPLSTLTVHTYRHLLISFIAV